MNKYSTKFINIVSFVISILIFIIIQVMYLVSSNIFKNTELKVGFFENKNISNEKILNQENQVKSKSEIQKIEIQENNQIISPKKEEIKTTENKSEELKKYNWYLEIPKINLKAEIAEGTSKEVMNLYIGHFTETQIKEGNIGLAAHNRGYKNNYFARLKELKNGDIIIYYYKGLKREYIVDKHCIISDEDWSYLENTEKNNITLITCIENEPTYRRCIRGIEKK